MTATNLKRAATLAAALLLAACASGGGTRSAAGDSAEARAVKRWELLIAGRTAEAYDYLSAGARSSKPRDAYAREMAERPVKWKSVELRDKRCDSADSCVVRLVLTYTLELPNTGALESPAPIEERWIAVNGVWYYLPPEFAPGKGLR